MVIFEYIEVLCHRLLTFIKISATMYSEYSSLQMQRKIRIFDVYSVPMIDHHGA
jgi:hypothetical protein